VQGANLAFYAPMKPPDHPVPSGDRQMARLLMRALTLAGFEPMLASRLRSHGFEPAETALAEAAARERASIIAAWDAMEAARRPRAWLTYHPYYKAPDLIGPEIAARFAIPYVTAEASYAGKRDRDEWAGLQRTVKAAVRAAALNICFTAEDREGLERLVAPERIADLAPFIDAELIPCAPKQPNGPVRLVTVAMMRSGAKLASYQMLARALGRILDVPWTLEIVGDGPERAAVAAAFAQCARRPHPLGRRTRRVRRRRAPRRRRRVRLARHQRSLWHGLSRGPGGRPARRRPGHRRRPDRGAPRRHRPPHAPRRRRRVFERNHPPDHRPTLRHRLGHAARKFVTEERSLPAAAAHLRRLLTPLLAPAPAGAP
jgi:hypothetical protein